MTKSRYAAASIAQYLHELSGRHADERAAHEHERDENDRPIERAIDARIALAGR